MQGGALCVTVSDTGIGVDPDDRERIFESFQQSARARGRTEGTGLGLTLCRRIVELFGGRMWLDSGSARGARSVSPSRLRSLGPIGSRRLPGRTTDQSWSLSRTTAGRWSS